MSWSSSASVGGTRPGHGPSLPAVGPLVPLRDRLPAITAGLDRPRKPGPKVPDAGQRPGRSVADMALLPERRDVTPLPDLLHGRSRAGPVRQERPVYVDLLPPCNAGCPAGENIQAWLAHAEAGRPRAGVAAAGRRQPAAGDPRPGLLPPVRERLQPRQPRQRRLDPRGRAVPRRPRARAGLGVRPAAGPQRQAGARHRRRAERAVGRLPSGPARPRGRDPRRRRPSPAG